MRSPKGREGKGKKDGIGIKKRNRVSFSTLACLLACLTLNEVVTQIPQRKTFIR